MVDTVKLIFEENEYTISSNELRFRSSEKGIQRAIRNPSASELKAGLYLPRITQLKRPNIGGMRTSLVVEFSAPKLVYGNNFDELVDADFDKVIDELLKALEYLRISIDRQTILNAKVAGWHPSKNVILADIFGCKTVINALHGVDASKTYNVQKTDFSRGEALHFHCNSKDIAFYDKLADLRRGKISDKRAIENDNRIQVEALDGVKDLSVLRFELRLSGVQAVRRTFNIEPTFQALFSSTLSREVLWQHWQKLTQNLDYLALNSMQPLAILESYLTEHPDATPQAALAATASLYIANQAGAGALKATLNARYGAHAWRRIKTMLQAPEANRHKFIMETSKAIDEFEPTELAMLSHKSLYKL